jgi:hypothetical protein
VKAYETTTTVEDLGQVHLSGVPFEAGTEVDITISPRRRSAEKFAAAWTRICGELRRQVPPGITDEEITEEVDRYRAAP